MPAGASDGTGRNVAGKDNVMKHICIALAVAATMMLGTPAHAASSGTPGAGAIFPDLTLPVPESADQRAYLGVAGGDTFQLKDI